MAKKAEARARKPFHSPRADLPAFLSQLTYDQYRQIAFRDDHALWTRGAAAVPRRVFPSWLSLPGTGASQRIHRPRTCSRCGSCRIFLITGRCTFRRKFRPTPATRVSRFLYPLNSPDKLDELGAFLGASYFRLLGQGQVYGLSARGLALDCGELGRPEEFPIFTDWWLGKPQHDDDELLLYAILDSVSCTGAYEFHIRPGATTVADVEAVLYFREPAQCPGRRPAAQAAGDHRLRAADEHVLVRRKFGTQVRRLPPGSPRQRRPAHAHGQRRNALASAGQRHCACATRFFRPATSAASACSSATAISAITRTCFTPITTLPACGWRRTGNWGEGQVHLVELSTQYEGLDNIVAFWDPANKPPPLQPLRFGYTLYWTRETDMKLSSNEVVSTRIGLDPRDQRQRQFVIDFDMPKLDALRMIRPRPMSRCSDNGTITRSRKSSATPRKRPGAYSSTCCPSPATTIPWICDARCAKRSDIVSETWTYHWSPP